MKSIVFRPLRLVKKTGKIVVASYPQWNKVRTADYGAFILTIDDEYKVLDPAAHVYNHEGKPLFWRDYNPANIPILDWMPDMSDQLAAIREASPNGYGIRWNPEGPTSYCCSRVGLDVQGTPCFAHFTIDRVAEHHAEWADYEPLTVGIVVKWLGWFIYQLENAALQIGK